MCEQPAIDRLGAEAVAGRRAEWELTGGNPTRGGAEPALPAPRRSRRPEQGPPRRARTRFPFRISSYESSCQNHAREPVRGREVNVFGHHAPDNHGPSPSHPKSTQKTQKRLREQLAASGPGGTLTPLLRPVPHALEEDAQPGGAVQGCQRGPRETLPPSHQRPHGFHTYDAPRWANQPPTLHPRAPAPSTAA